MSELILGHAQVDQVAEKDALFAGKMIHARRDFISLLRRSPAYIKALTDEMQPADLYRARLPGEILAQLDKGEHEQMLKRSSSLWNGMIRKSGGRKEIVAQAEWEKVKLDRQSLADLNQIALQATMAAISEQLLVMDRKLDLLLSGQHTDRIAKVLAGIHLYEQAQTYKDAVRRNQQLANALQSLVEGRTMLFGELSTMLAHQKRDSSLIDRLWWRFIFRVDKPVVELFRQLEAERPKLVESIKFVSLSSAYMLRVHALLEEQDAGKQSLRQCVAFFNLVCDKAKAADGVYPYDLINCANEMAQIKQRMEDLSNHQGDLVVEVTYEELLDAEV